MIKINIYSRFAVTGSILYDPDRILSHLYVQIQKPIPPLLSETIPTYQTPKQSQNFVELKS